MTILIRVVKEGFFILLPAIAVFVFGLENPIDATVHHEYAVVFELMLCTFILVADTLKEVMENELTWKGKWHLLKVAALLVSVVVILAIGFWFGADSKVHPYAPKILVGVSSVIWVVVKSRVVYAESVQRRFLIEHWKGY